MVGLGVVSGQCDLNDTTSFVVRSGAVERRRVVYDKEDGFFTDVGGPV